jgi:hypothetical protein
MVNTPFCLEGEQKRPLSIMMGVNQSILEKILKKKLDLGIESMVLVLSKNIRQGKH